MSAVSRRARRSAVAELPDAQIEQSDAAPTKRRRRYITRDKEPIVSTTTIVVLVGAFVTSLAFVLIWIVKSRRAAAELANKKKEEEVAKAQTKAVADQLPSMSTIPNAENNFAPVTAPSYTSIIGGGKNERIYTLAELLGQSTPPSLSTEELMFAAVGGAMGAGAQSPLRQQSGREDAFLDDNNAQAPSNTGEMPELTADQQRLLDLRQRAEWDVNSIAYCGEPGWIYTPSPETKNNPESKGRCLKQCPLGEDFDIWRAPAGDSESRSYHWVCKKRCPPGTQDQDGFCRRRLFNPEWLVGFRPQFPTKDPNQKPPPYDPSKPSPFLPGFPGVPVSPIEGIISTDNMYCGTSRHYGRYCINVGTEEKHGDFSKTPMDCSKAEGFMSTPSKLSCYKCKPGTERIGTEQSGYLCAEPCPAGSTSKGTGSTYACYVESTPFDDKTNIIAPFSEADVKRRAGSPAS